MSSRHQLYAWRALKEAVVKTIIDLRLNDHTDRLPALCEEYGMQYFHYPVDISAEAIVQMVEMSPQFYELVDDGNSYIACAMGLHRTDIAHCAYWMFHGADKEYNHQKNWVIAKRHNTDKLNRALNAMYQAFSDLEGIANMTDFEFKQRKNIMRKL